MADLHPHDSRPGPSIGFGVGPKPLCRTMLPGRDALSGSTHVPDCVVDAPIFLADAFVQIGPRRTAAVPLALVEEVARITGWALHTVGRITRAGERCRRIGSRLDPNTVRR